MLQKAGKQLWTLLLALTLLGSGVVSTPRPTWADSAPSEPGGPPPPPDNGSGDPDWPWKKNPGVSPPRGGVHEPMPVRSVWAEKWMWSFRMAFASVSRFFLRF